MVLSRAKDWMPRLVTEALAVDPGLRMLDPNANREGLRLDMDAGCLEHFEAVARAMTDREHHMVRFQIPAAVQVQAAQPTRAVGVDLNIQPVHARAEAIFAAERLDRRADALDHRH